MANIDTAQEGEVCDVKIVVVCLKWKCEAVLQPLM